ncbi:hypothetical protein Bbad01_37280 [Bacillus badius]|nr:hypothetical protein Bbad01_37280 [Bacillus badius]
MELEGSYYNLEEGIVKIPKLIGKSGYRKEAVTKDGYLYFSLRDTKRKRYCTLYLHHLVMILADGEAYIEQMSNGMTINHKDGNKANNSLNNLEYLSHNENVAHAYVTGLIKENPLEELISEHEVYKILSAYNIEGKSVEELSKVFKISVSAINKIVKGRLHSHVYTMFKAFNAGAIRTIKKGSSKLTDEQVKSILRMYHVEGITQAVIAERQNVSRSTVAMVVTGQRWKELYEEFHHHNKQRA